MGITVGIEENEIVASRDNIIDPEDTPIDFETEHNKTITELREMLFLPTNKLVTEPALLSMGINRIRARLEDGDIRINEDKVKKLIKLVTEVDPSNVEPLFACYFAGREDLTKYLAEINPHVKKSFEMMQRGEFECVKENLKTVGKGKIGIHYSKDLKLQHVFTTDPKGNPMLVGRVVEPKLMLSIEDSLDQFSIHGGQTLIDKAKKGKVNRVLFYNDLAIEINSDLLYGPAIDTIYKLSIITNFVQALPDKMLESIRSIVEVGVGSGTLLYGVVNAVLQNRRLRGMLNELNVYATDINMEALAHTEKLLSRVEGINTKLINSEVSLQVLSEMVEGVDIIMCNPPYVTTQLLETYIKGLVSKLENIEFKSPEDQEKYIANYYWDFVENVASKSIGKDGVDKVFNPKDNNAAIEAGITGTNLYAQMATTGMELIGENGVILTLFSSISEDFVKTLFPSNIEIYELDESEETVPLELTEVTNNPHIGSMLFLLPGVQLNQGKSSTFSHTIKVVAMCEAGGSMSDYFQSIGKQNVNINPIQVQDSVTNLEQ